MAKKYSFILLLLTVSLGAFAQQWVQDMYNPAVNFFTVQQEFNQWYAEHEEEIRSPEHEEEGGDEGYAELYNLYKRWEFAMEPHMRRTHGVREGTLDQAELRAMMQRLQRPRTNGRGGSAWKYIGPTEPMNFYGATHGRINRMRQDPTDTNIVYACAPNGGAWKSTDQGETWHGLNTDFLFVNGVSDIAIRPDNNQVLFIATGDWITGSYRSSGILKSTDGGNTWDTTSITWTPSQGRWVSSIIINPEHPDTMFATTSVGLYRSTDGGDNWSLLLPGARYDVAFKPGNASTVYVIDNRFQISTDNGNNWNTIDSATLTSYSYHSILVTKADSNYVYLFTEGANLRKSVNGGQTFAWLNQPYYINAYYPRYTCGAGVSQVNKNFVCVGAQGMAYSLNGGVTWSQPTGMTHADYHDFKFSLSRAGTFYACDDGGIYRSVDSGRTWTGLNKGLNVGQIYRTSSSAQTPYMNISGRQDMGTHLKTDYGFEQLTVGDGMGCVIDPVNDSILYTTAQAGVLWKLTNGGRNETYIGDFNTGWITPLNINPQNHNSIYIGLNKSVDGGNTWFPIALGGNTEHAISPVDTNFIYAVTYGKVLKSTDGGFTATKCLDSVPFPQFVEADPDDPLKFWVATNDSVYFSTDSGAHFTSYCDGLPEGFIPRALCCVKHSPGGIYLGLDNGGVYYRDSLLGSWIPYSSGLPNSPVYDLEISYAAAKLRAATYGRDLWESDLYDNWNNPPVAIFSGEKKIICIGGTVQYTDTSSFSPSTRYWSFPGGNPSSSTDQYVTVSYPTAGVYDAMLIAVNQYGTDTLIRHGYVTVFDSITEVVSENFESGIFPTGWRSVSVSFDTSRWNLASPYNAYGGGTHSIFCGNSGSYTGSDNPMVVTELHLPAMNFTRIARPVFKFDYAYMTPYQRLDTLSVWVSSDCGQTFTKIFSVGGDSLSTRITSPSYARVPDSTEWKTKHLDISAFGGLENVQIKFVFGRGFRYPYANQQNYIYLDNIQVNTEPRAFFGANPTTICAGENVSFTDSAISTSIYKWILPGAMPDTAEGRTPQIYYSTPGVYSATLIASNGFASDTLTRTNYITVLSAPPVNVTADKTVICKGDTVRMSATGAVQYTWAPLSGLSNSHSASTIAQPDTNILYTVTGLDSNQCSASDSIVINVNLPLKPELGNDTALCSGESLTLNAGFGFAAYAWSTGDSVQSIIATAQGSYTLTTIDSNGCRDADTTRLTIYSLPFLNLGSDTALCEGTDIIIDAGQGFATYNWTIGDTVRSIQVNQTGNYTVAITDGNGCHNSDSIRVMFITPHFITLGNDTAVCPGERATLNASSGFASYAWSTGDTTQSINAATQGEYAIAAVDSNGCHVFDTANVTIYREPFVALGNDTTICSGLLVTINGGDGFIAYTWSTGDTTKTIAVNGQGLYSILVIDSNGCQTSDTISITTTICNGLDKPNAENVLQIYPNPNSGWFTIAMISDLSGPVKMNLYNSLGQLLQSSEIEKKGNGFVEMVDAGYLPVGAYWITLSGNDFRVTRPVLIKQ